MKWVNVVFLNRTHSSACCCSIGSWWYSCSATTSLNRARLVTSLRWTRVVRVRGWYCPAEVQTSTTTTRLRYSNILTLLDRLRYSNILTLLDRREALLIIDEVRAWHNVSWGFMAIMYTDQFWYYQRVLILILL